MWRLFIKLNSTCFIQVDLVPEHLILQNLINDFPGVLEIQTYGELLHLFVDSAERRLPEIKAALEERGIAYRGARHATARMEEAFISLIRRLEED